MVMFRFCKWIAEGQPVVVNGDGKQTRGYTYLDDVARGTILAMRPMGFEIINLGGHEVISVNKLIDILEFLYTTFCDLFPSASDNKEVVEILAKQYLGVLYYSPIRLLHKAIPMVVQSMSRTKQFQKIIGNIFIQIVHEGPSHLKYWVFRSWFGKTI